jgi:hypothetical protein
MPQHSILIGSKVEAILLALGLQARVIQQVAPGAFCG